MIQMRRGVRVSDHDETLFQRASEIALQGEHHRVRVGAILTKGRTTLHTGYNRTRNIDKNVPYGAATWHAERQVLADVYARSNCTLYVARLDLSEAVVASWPCDECMQHIVACDCVRKICYYDGHSLVKVRM